MTRHVYAYRCQKCATVHYPFRMRCKECGENDLFGFDPVPLPPQGTLITFTHVHNLPAEYEVERLGLGIVELENGVRVLGQLDIDHPSLGMAVVADIRIVRRETYDDYYGMVFNAA